MMLSLMMPAPVTVMSSEARQPGMRGHEPVCGWQDEIAGWLREPEPVPAGSELPPEQVAAWLRSQEGERWSQARIGELERQQDDSGVFADVRDTISSNIPVQSRWPEPYFCHDLEDD